jgi:branched-chain amino acid transport system permease protein
MDIFLQRLFDGLSIGAIYALLALGLVVVFRGTGHLNFAQGEMATLSAFVVWVLQDRGVPLALAALLGVAFGFAIGAVTEIAMVRPLAKRSHGAVFVASIALFLGINSLTNGLWGDFPDEVIGSLFPAEPTDFSRIFGAVWRHEYIGVLLVTLLLMGLLFTLFQKTRFGLAMRGVANNPESARLVGVRTGTVLAVSWGIAGALGAIAGTLFAGVQGQVRPSLMISVFVYAVAAATLGGLDSPGGAVIAGLLIGVGENLSAGYLETWVGQEMKLAVALLAIFVVLIFRPSGMFGSARIERV